MGIFSYFKKRRANREILDRLYGAVMAAARGEALYRDLQVPDTFEGRFESFTLHASLVARRLNMLPSPAPDLARDFVDRIFSELDGMLREMGVGDMGVPKRIKQMAAAFLGRAGAYVDALQSEDRQVMKDVLIRNIYASRRPADDCVEKLIDYVNAFSRTLDGLALDAFTSENVSQTLMIKAIKE
jgi:cytochrome b pre-mRNA-processing protein 3